MRSAQRCRGGGRISRCASRIFFAFPPASLSLNHLPYCCLVLSTLEIIEKRSLSHPHHLINVLVHIFNIDFVHFSANFHDFNDLASIFIFSLPITHILTPTYLAPGPKRFNVLPVAGNPENFPALPSHLPPPPHACCFKSDSQISKKKKKFHQIFNKVSSYPH